MTEQEKVDFYVKRYGVPNNGNSSSCLALAVSFLIPIVGVVCYFAQRDRVSNPNSYLIAALIGWIASILLVLASH